MPKLTLNDICQYRNENMLSTDLSDNVYISTETMQPNREGISSSDIVTPTTKKVKAFYPGDILVSNIRPYFKKIWRATFAGGCSNDVLVFSPKCNSEYLYWLLSTDSFFNYMMATSKGTKMPRGDKKAIMKYIAPDHSDKEQRQIASFLNPLQNKIALNNRINDYLDELCDALFYKFIDSQDDTWRKGTLDELLDIKYGKDHKKLADGPYPVYGSGGYMRSVERPLASGESVLIPRKGTLNNVMYVNEEFWTVDTMFYSIPRVPGAAKYAFQYIKKLNLASMNSGSAVPSMTTAILNALQLPIPNQNTLIELDNKLQPMYALAAANREEVKQLVFLRDTLLPKLMSGEIDVSGVLLNE